MPPADPQIKSPFTLKEQTQLQTLFAPNPNNPFNNAYLLIRLIPHHNQSLYSKQVIEVYHSKAISEGAAINTVHNLHRQLGWNYASDSDAGYSVFYRMHGFDHLGNSVDKGALYVDVVGFGDEWVGGGGKQTQTELYSPGVTGSELMRREPSRTPAVQHEKVCRENLMEIANGR